jgi:hypothetical protein
MYGRDARINPLNFASEEICVPVEYTYFTNALFARFHASLTPMFIYCTWKPGNANLTAILISRCMK